MRLIGRDNRRGIGRQASRCARSEDRPPPYRSSERGAEAHTPVHRRFRLRSHEHLSLYAARRYGTGDLVELVDGQAAAMRQITRDAACLTAQEGVINAPVPVHTGRLSGGFRRRYPHYRGSIGAMRAGRWDRLF